MYNMEVAKKEEKQKQQTKIVNELENVKNIITEVTKETVKEENLEFKKIEKEIGIVLLKKNIEIQAVRYREIKNGKCIIIYFPDSIKFTDPERISDYFEFEVLNPSTDNTVTE